MLFFFLILSCTYIYRKLSNVSHNCNIRTTQVSVLHGDLLPEERDKVMDDFRAGRTKVKENDL